MVAKATSNGRSATPTTAIPNSGELAGDCGFAYPLLVYWNRSLSVPLFPSLSIYSKIIPSPSPFRLLSRLRSSSSPPPLSPFPRLSSSLVHLSSFFLRLNPLGQAHPPPPPPLTVLRDFISPRSLSLASPRPSSSSLALYLPISISPLSAAQTLGHVHKAHRSPAFITRYEIAPRLRPGSPIPTSPRIRSPDGDAAPRRTAPSRYTLANFANVGSRRITHLQQYRFFLHPRSAPRDEIRSLLSRTVLSRRGSDMKSFFIR